MNALDFTPPPRKPARESVVPMINVVFLLLIFFLMSAQIAPPEPVEVTPPVVREAETLPEGARMLWLGRDGGLHFEGLTGEAALDALARAPEAVHLRADASLEAAEFARVLQMLGEVGVTSVTLVAVMGAP